MISADRKMCSSSLHGGAFYFLDFILKDQLSENCTFSVSIYEGSPSKIELPFASKTEANKISLSQFPAFSLTGNPGFNFKGKTIDIITFSTLQIHIFIPVSWLDHHGTTMSFFHTHIIDITLSHCGFARISNCGSNMSLTSNVSCSGTSSFGSISIDGMIVRGDATTSCEITCKSRNYSSIIFDSFAIEIRASNLYVNLNSFPSRLYLGSPFSVSCKKRRAQLICIFLILIQTNFKTMLILNSQVCLLCQYQWS
jgi:hypothetical protein